MPEHMRMEAADAGDLGPAAKGEMQGVVADAATAVPEPQRRGVGQAMLAAQPQVAVEGAAVCGPNGTSRPLPPLPRRTCTVPPRRSRSSTWRATVSPARRPVSVLRYTSPMTAVSVTAAQKTISAV
jgi:hypothetical protein